MQRGRDALGYHAGAESPRCAPAHPTIKDELDLAGPPDVQVLADDLLEEDAPGHRPAPAEAVCSGRTWAALRTLARARQRASLPGQGGLPRSQRARRRQQRRHGTDARRTRQRLGLPLGEPTARKPNGQRRERSGRAWGCRLSVAASREPRGRGVLIGVTNLGEDSFMNQHLTPARQVRSYEVTGLLRAIRS